MVALSLIASPLPKRSLGAVWPLQLGLALVGFGGLLLKPRVVFPWMQSWVLTVQSGLGVWSVAICTVRDFFTGAGF